MYSSQVARDQEFAPLLFSLVSPSEGVPSTPRTGTPLRTAESSISTRRSVTPPGSALTEATPHPLPPPTARLTDDMQDEPSTSKAVRFAAISPTVMGSLTPMHNLQHAQLSTNVQQTDDVWVTIFGFMPKDLAQVLSEFSRCGEILQWGTFGEVYSNFIHVQFSNKYAAQRALQKSGDYLGPGLIIGVKPLDSRHRNLLSTDLSMSHISNHVLPALPERTYKVDTYSNQSMPQASKSMVSKFLEYVLGL